MILYALIVNSIVTTVTNDPYEPETETSKWVVFDSDQVSPMLGQCYDPYLNAFTTPTPVTANGQAPDSFWKTTEVVPSDPQVSPTSSWGVTSMDGAPLTVANNVTVTGA
jgi:hypothetical protein